MKMQSKKAFENLKEYCGHHGVDYELNVSLKSFSVFKTGGIALIVLFPRCISNLVLIFQYLVANEIRFKLVGETSNLLFLDDVEFGCLLVTTGVNSIVLNSSSGTLEVDAGFSLPELARFALLNSIKGFEGFEGIPGSVGGAVFMNAGAYGYEVKDVLKGVDVLDADLGEYYLPVRELKFNNRSSVFREASGKSIVILKAYFRVEYSDSKKIYKNMSLFHSKRHKYQEFMYPTLGSLYSGSVYRSLARRNVFYKIMSFLYFLIFYKLKLFMREAPNDRILFNSITINMFKICYTIQPFSDKDMNTLTNRGQHTDEFLRYIEQMESLVGDDLRVENEIVADFNFLRSPPHPASG